MITEGSIITTSQLKQPNFGFYLSVSVSPKVSAYTCVPTRSMSIHATTDILQVPIDS